MSIVTEKKVPLMKKTINWNKIGTKTVIDVFGKTGTVGGMTKSLWKVIKANDLIVK